MIERFNRNALTNQFLIEAIVGVQTVKAMAVEPMLRVQWEERLAAYVKSSFVTVMLASLGQNAIQYINATTTALVLFFGAYAVMNGSLTVGSLIAFNMITAQITAPILRLSQLWQDFQQVKVSIERIGDVLDAPPETRSLAQSHLPPAKGQLSVRNVVFRYRSDLPEVLKDVSIEVEAGQVLGIVGPSGSGKSTFTKLLQRLYVPEKGQVLVDGVDVAQVDPAWLQAPDRRGTAGKPTVPQDGGGEHSTGQSWHVEVAGDRSRPPGRCRRLHQPAFYGVRHTNRGARRKPVGGSTSTSGYRPRACYQPADSHPR